MNHIYEISIRKLCVAVIVMFVFSFAVTRLASESSGMILFLVLEPDVFYFMG